MTNRERQANLWAIGIGVLATAFVCALHADGRLDWLEYKTLDLRFCYANSIPQSDELVRIDIDDSALEKVGRWPWPRYKQACLISVPAELGARALVVDIEYTEPEVAAIADSRIDEGTFDPRAGAGQTLEWRPSDRELRAAIAQAGNVYLAFHDDKHSTENGFAFNALVDELLAARRPDAAGFRPDAIQRAQVKAARLGGESATELFHHALLVAALATPHPAGEADAEPASAALHFDTPADVLTAQLALAPEFVDRDYSKCLEAAARRIVERELRRDAGLAERNDDALRGLLVPRITHDPPEERTARTEAVAQALRQWRGTRATRLFAYASDPRLSEIAQPMNAVQPVAFELAAAARRCGFVMFEADSDKVARSVPVLATTGDALVFPQLAFGCGADLLGATKGRDTPGVSYDAGRRTLIVGDRELQLDRQGRVMVPWVPDRDVEAAKRRHVPADALYQVIDRRAKIVDNTLRMRDALEQLYDSRQFPDLDDSGKEPVNLEELHDLMRIPRAALEPAQAAALDAAERRLDERERAMRDYVHAEKVRIAGTPREQRTSADELRADWIDLFEREIQRLVEPERRANEKLRQEIAQTLDLLRKRIAGKVCVIGYTATALADMTPTPTSRRAPGVLAHYWLLNGMLTNRLVHWASPLQNFILTSALGILATLVAVLRGPRGALLTLPPIALLYVALAGWAAFYYWTFWFAVVPPVLAMMLAVVLIAFHRYIFIERERRELATALAQYTSKAIARQVAENPELCKRAESREVTVIFTDVRGFTQIAERIGAQRTQKVLNACLERCTEVLINHEAMVNKFMGDGIFAFWNPVIFEQLDHAVRACESAVDLQTAMAALAREQAAKGGDPVFAEIVTRVGIASGNAVVGPCGSAMKYDYTCIGDSVNVASRLESANKFFGTLMLVNEDTQRAVGDRFMFRPLGGVRVKGKHHAVQVFELLGRPKDISSAQRAYAEAFAVAVMQFQQREFAAAQAAFAACLATRPDDLAAQHYRDAAARLLETPPGDDWLGAIELEEK